MCFWGPLVVVPGFRIAITGTPGTGKTTLCAALAGPVVSVSRLAAAHGCLGEVDATDGAAPVDVEALAAAALPEGFVDGHLSHLLPVDGIVLLRCHPEVLRARLEARGYTAEKVEANVESELLGTIAAECEDRPCLELDSEAGSNALIGAVDSWVSDGFKPRRPNEAIDWIDRIHGGD